MLVLGIETSCDETAASVVRDGKAVLSNEVSSSLHLHRKFGGIVPEIASRFHAELIGYVVERALKRAGCRLDEIQLIGVTYGPGLVGALLVGISMAKAISMARGIPVIGVNHLLAHIYAPVMGRDGLRFPFIGLVVSGGHTCLVFVEDFHKCRLLGQTTDDAVGEAFDKVAKILGLAFPGGPVIEKRARGGNPRKINFPRSRLKGNALDFSFSGIKTAVLYYVHRTEDRRQKTEDRKQKTARPGKTEWAGEDRGQKTETRGQRAEGRSNNCLSPGEVADIAASFQEAVMEDITEKALLACRLKHVRRLVVGGGVSANSRLRSMLGRKARRSKVRVHFPSQKLCLDNAAMVAGLSYALYKRGLKFSGLDFSAVPNLSI